MQVRLLRFGSVEVDGQEYNHDIVVEGGRVQKRQKKASKPYRDHFGHTPLSADEELPWGGRSADHRHRGLRLATDHARGRRGGSSSRRRHHRPPH